MGNFNVGDSVEALDEGCVWSRGNIVAREGDKFVISFNGFGSQWNTSVGCEKLRPIGLDINNKL